MAIGVDERFGRRRKHRVRADRRGREVGTGDRVGGVPRGVVRGPVDERATAGQGRSVGRVLQVTVLGRLPAHVDGECRGSEEHDKGQGHDDEHLSALGGRMHQLTTIVTFAENRTRFEASAPISVPTRGTKSGWR